MILIMESVQITCLQMLKPFHSDVCSRLNRFASSPCIVLEAAILIGDVRRYYVISTSPHCDVIERHRFDACCENTVWIFASRFISHVLSLITSKPLEEPNDRTTWIPWRFPGGPHSTDTPF